MIVPVGEFLPSLGRIEIHIDDGGSGFGQSAGKQTTLPPLVVAVSFTESRVFAFDIECFRHFRTGEHLEGEAAKLLDAAEFTRDVQIVAHSIELPDELLAVFEKAGIATGSQLDLRRCITF